MGVHVSVYTPMCAELLVSFSSSMDNIICKSSAGKNISISIAVSIYLYNFIFVASIYSIFLCMCIMQNIKAFFYLLHVMSICNPICFGVFIGVHCGKAA